MTKEQLDSVLAIIDGYDARMKIVREYFDRREPVPEEHKQYLAPLEDEDVVKAFEALRPLVARVLELEIHKRILACRLSKAVLHPVQEERSIDEWIKMAEEAAKEAGE